MKLKTRILRSVLFLVVLLTGAAVAAVVYQTREVNAQEYRQVREAFKAGAPEVQARIAAAMADGEISRGEYLAIVRQQWPMNPPPLGNDASNVAEEKVILGAMSRQVKQQ